VWLGLVVLALPQAQPGSRGGGRPRPTRGEQTEARRAEPTEARRGEQAAAPRDGLSARERWARLSPEEQARIRSRFERLQRMSADERAELEQRSRRRAEQRTRLLASLAPEERDRLLRQPPERREALLREMAEAERRDHGRRIAQKLPEELRESLRRAGPEERARRLEVFKRDAREHLSRRAVEGLAGALGYGEREIARLERLPLEERMRTVLSLRKQLTARELEASGLPPGLTRERWESLEALPPEEYLRELWRLHRRGVLGPVPGLEVEQGGDRLRARDREALRAIGQALHAPPRDFVEFSDLEPTERRAAIERRLRERVEGLLASRGLLTAEELAPLSGLSDRDYLDGVRDLVDRRLAGVRGRRRGQPERSRE
jgi:hypothetical protein